jgi:hypothetical protein
MLKHVPARRKLTRVPKSFPAGMEPMESSDIDEARKGERAGASESIEAQARACTRVSKTYVTTDAFPAGIEPTSKV